jgi:hypothetical protein
MVINCVRCSSEINLKPNAQPRKYCAKCKETMKTNWQSKVRDSWKQRTKNKPIETLKPL